MGEILINNLSVPVKIVIAMLVTVGSSTWGMAWWFSKGQQETKTYFDSKFTEFETRLTSMEARMQTSYDDRFTLTMKSEDAFRTALANPNLLIPDPRDPGKFIRVNLPTGVTP